MSPPAELGALPELDGESVLRVLRERAHAGEPYTGAAGCLVAVNPCEPMPELYGAAVQAAHSGECATGARAAPHVFAVAAHAYGALSRGEAAHHVSSGRHETSKSKLTTICLH
jgi:myosin heavy subunit